MKSWILTFWYYKTGPAKSFNFMRKRTLRHWTKWYVTCTLVQFLKKKMLAANLTFVVFRKKMLRILTMFIITYKCVINIYLKRINQVNVVYASCYHVSMVDICMTIFNRVYLKLINDFYNNSIFHFSLS